MNTSTGTDTNATVTITYDGREVAAKELCELLARMEWRQENDEDFDWHGDDCHYCNGQATTAVTVSAGVDGAEYRLEPGQHDRWCPFARLKEVIRQQVGDCAVSEAHPEGTEDTEHGS
jgi:hypothetical protein